MGERCDYRQKRRIRSRTVFYGCTKPYDHDSGGLHSQLGTHRYEPEEKLSFLDHFWIWSNEVYWAIRRFARG